MLSCSHNLKRLFKDNRLARTKYVVVQVVYKFLPKNGTYISNTISP